MMCKLPMAKTWRSFFLTSFNFFRKEPSSFLPGVQLLIAEISPSRGCVCVSVCTRLCVFCSSFRLLTPSVFSPLFHPFPLYPVHQHAKPQLYPAPSITTHLPSMSICQNFVKISYPLRASPSSCNGFIWCSCSFTIILVDS